MKAWTLLLTLGLVTAGYARGETLGQLARHNERTAMQPLPARVAEIPLSKDQLAKLREIAARFQAARDPEKISWTCPGDKVHSAKECFEFGKAKYGANCEFSADASDRDCDMPQWGRVKTTKINPEDTVWVCKSKSTTCHRGLRSDLSLLTNCPPHYVPLFRNGDGVCLKMMEPTVTKDAAEEKPSGVEAGPGR